MIGIQLRLRNRNRRAPLRIRNVRRTETEIQSSRRIRRPAVSVPGKRNLQSLPEKRKRPVLKLVEFRLGDGRRKRALIQNPENRQRRNGSNQFHPFPRTVNTGQTQFQSPCGTRFQIRVFKQILQLLRLERQRKLKHSPRRIAPGKHRRTLRHRLLHHLRFPSGKNPLRRKILRNVKLRNSSILRYRRILHFQEFSVGPLDPDPDRVTLKSLISHLLDQGELPADLLDLESALVLHIDGNPEADVLVKRHGALGLGAGLAGLRHALLGHELGGPAAA